MKTHDLAHALTQLARALRAGPNIEVGDLSFVSANLLNGNGTGKANAAVSLNILFELSRFDKEDWGAIIEENNFPIPIRPRDSSRDLIGKLLRHLEQNVEARERLKSNIGKRP